MDRREFRIGPGAASLILVVMVVSMSVLGLLALLSVRSDTRLTQRSLAVVEAQYAAIAQAERDLAMLEELAAEQGEDFELPEGFTREDGRIVWNASSDSAVLHCAVSRDSGGFVWQDHSFVTILEDSSEDTFMD